jgi:hypothetical protein
MQQVLRAQDVIAISTEEVDDRHGSHFHQSFLAIAGMATGSNVEKFKEGIQVVGSYVHTATLIIDMLLYSTSISLNQGKTIGYRFGASKALFSHLSFILFLGLCVRTPHRQTSFV